MKRSTQIFWWVLPMFGCVGHGLRFKACPKGANLSQCVASLSFIFTSYSVDLEFFYKKILYVTYYLAHPAFYAGVWKLKTLKIFIRNIL